MAKVDKNCNIFAYYNITMHLYLDWNVDVDNTGNQDFWAKALSTDSGYF